MADKVLDAVFNKFLTNADVFENRKALTLFFTPEKIPHRQEQITELGKILAPVLRGGKPSNIFVYGRTGTGKSLVSSFVGAELERVGRENDVPIKVVYINCKLKKRADTEYRLLASILRELGREIPFTGLPTEQVYNIFVKTVDKKKNSLILIIDEIDALIQKNGDEVLYNLTRINQELKNSKISIIGITNNIGFIEKLDPRIKSTLGEEEIIFPPYNAVQLKDILHRRAILAFKPDIVADGVIEKCAALGAQEHGDARRALDLLRVAGELAERNSEIRVCINHVDLAQEKIDVDRTLEFIKAQPKQSQVVLRSIVELSDQKDIQTGDIMTKYQDLCKESGLRSLTQRRVSDLIAELDLFGIINSRVISKGRYGRTRVVTLPISKTLKEKIKKLLYQLLL